MEEHWVDKEIRKSREQSQREEDRAKIVAIFIVLFIIAIGVFGLKLSLFTNAASDAASSFGSNLVNFFN